MVITWFGQFFFEIKTKDSQNKEVCLVIDPFDEKIGLKVPQLEAQILLVTHSHFDHSNIEAIKGSPFLINEPGEYEIRNVFIKGILSFHDDSQGKERGINVIYSIEAEGIRISHLGDLGQKELTPEQLEELGRIDVLLIPIGGIFTINAQKAANIISQLEPKIVIPMHYQIPKLKLELEGLDKFFKIMAKEKIEPQKRLKITTKDLSKETTEVVVLSPFQ